MAACALYAFVGLTAAGCSSLPLSSRPELAADIAVQADMRHETLDAPPFTLTAYARIGATGRPATIYIEGDGQAWLDRTTPSMDPTPTDPVALRLAAADPAANVIWLARPCQYTKMAGNTSACPNIYWTGSRLAPEVIASLNAAIDGLKKEYGLTELNLVGFSGGGGASVLIAARRHDIASLRTVAGNVNHALFSQIHNVSPMTGSLDPYNVAFALRDIPQIHFTGTEDRIVPSTLAQSLLNAENASPCARIMAVDGMKHDNGWATQWSHLLSVPLSCGPSR